MKKRILVLLLALMTALALLPAVTGAASAASPVKVTVDGKTAVFNSEMGIPYIDASNRTMVPFRTVANLMPGVQVAWISEIREACFYVDRASCTVNSQNAYVSVNTHFPIDADYFWVYVEIRYASGEVVDAFTRYWPMDTKAVVRNGRTYAPIRYLAEAFNYTVSWVGSTKTVQIANPHPDYWGGYFLQAEQARGNNRVPSDFAANLLATEYVRYSWEDVRTVPTCQGKSTVSDGRTVWQYRYAFQYGGAVHPIEFKVYSDGQIYFKLPGESSYQRWQNRD